VHRIHLDDYKGSTSLHVIKILVRSLGFTHISLRNHIPKMLCIFWRDAYAPYATCMATPLPLATNMKTIMIGTNCEISSTSLCYSTGWAKTPHHFKVSNSCVWWHRRAVHTSECSVLHLELD